MIKVLLMGGLGNQMLQYASAKTLATKLKTDLCVDLSFYAWHGQKDWCRAYELGIFSTSTMVCSRTFCGTLLCLLIPKLKHFFGKKALFRMGIITDLEQLNHANKPNYYLMDYFFSDHFFKQNRKEILQEFTFKLPINAANRAIENAIRDSEYAVSLHIRRGDYLSNAAAANTFANIPQSYYLAAMTYLEQNEKKQPTYFVFSDDIAWCKTFLPVNCVFVDCNHGSDSWNDMRLMSLCKHNIIANSTFSWWAAWLNSNINKIVIAPKNWYKKKQKNDNNDRYPSNFICL